MLIVFFFLLWLHKRRRFSGQVILFYALLYSIIRFSIEFVRARSAVAISWSDLDDWFVDLANHQCHCRWCGVSPD